MVSRPRIRWLTDVPRPYTAVLFRALADSEVVDLDVYFAKGSMGSHPWNESIDTGFRSRLYRTRAKIDWKLVGIALRARSEIFVVAGWNDPTMQLVSLIRRLTGSRYWIYTDTPDFGWLPRGPVKAWIRGRWLRFILSGAERVLGTGRPALVRLATLGAQPDRLANLPYFIELDRYQMTERKSAGPILLGSAGQLVPRKQLDIALRALGLLARRGLRDWTYQIIGSGPEQETLQMLARAEGIEDKVEWLGWLEGKNLIDFFDRCDVFLHPCEFEPWGVVVMEAMASGTAVLCSDQTFVANDWIDPKRNGLIHRMGDVEDLAEKLEWLLGDRSRIRDLGRAGREAVMDWPVSRGVEEIATLASAYTSADPSAH